MKNNIETPECLSDISSMPKSGLVVVLFLNHIDGGTYYDFVRIKDGIYYISPFDEFNLEVNSWDEFVKNNENSTTPLGWFSIVDNEDYEVNFIKS